MRVLVATVYGIYIFFCFIYTKILRTTFYIPEKHANLLNPSDHPMTLKKAKILCSTFCLRLLDNKRWSVHLWYETINNDLIFVTFLIIYFIILKHDRDRRLTIAWQIFTDVLIRPRTSNQSPVSVWLAPGLRQSRAHERSTKTTVRKRSWACYQKWASMEFMSVLLNSSVHESYTKLTV